MGCCARDSARFLAVASRGRTYGFTRVFGPPPSTELTTITYARFIVCATRSTTTAVATRAPFQHAAMAVCSTSRHGFLRRARLAERASRSTRHDRPQTFHVSLVFCQLSARSRCCSRSRRASPVLHAHTCAARPPRGSEALFGGDTSCCAIDSRQPRDSAKDILRLSLTGRQTKMARLPSPRRQEDCRRRVRIARWLICAQLPSISSL